MVRRKENKDLIKDYELDSYEIAEIEDNEILTDYDSFDNYYDQEIIRTEQAELLYGIYEDLCVKLA